MSCRVCLLTSLLALTTSALRTPRRQCIKAAGAALLPAAATALLPAAAAVAAAPSEVEAVLANERWDPESSFTREDFRRLDESDDKDFYTEPRFVYHIDDAAVAATASFYSNLFQRSAAASSSRPVDALDLCSSWVSHYPTSGATLGRVEGLGMNLEELKANPQLTGYLVRDLNKEPILPYADASFDIITMTVSIDYLTKPLAVIREAARCLRPGGQIAIVFSNRLFFSKAVALWTGKDDLDHVLTVGSYIHYGAPTLLSEPRSVDLTPPKRRGSKGGDPLYAVVATRLAPGESRA